MWHLLCKNGLTDRTAVWDGEWNGLKESYHSYGSRFPWEGEFFFGGGCPLVSIGFFNALDLEWSNAFEWCEKVENFITFPSGQYTNGNVFRRAVFKVIYRPSLLRDRSSKLTVMRKLLKM